MEGIGLLLSVLAFIVVGAMVVLVIASHLSNQQIENQQAHYRELAHRLGGRFEKGGFLGTTKVTFRHGDVVACVDSYSTGSDDPIDFTRVQLRWSAASVRCEVFPQRAVHRWTKLLGMEDIEIGVPDFDNDFIISGSDHELVRELLSSKVRAILQQVRAHAVAGDMCFSVSGRELLLRCRGNFHHVADLEQFVRTATALYDAAAARNDGGVLFLDAPKQKPATPSTATCQICGESITADPVYCKSCRTPHHHDCWEYHGKCSTFGCRERAYFRPGRQAAAKGRK